MPRSAAIRIAAALTALVAGWAVAGPARAATTPPLPPPGFYAYPEARWAAETTVAGVPWVSPDLPTAYVPGSPLSREGAARILVFASHQLFATQISGDVYTQAVDAGWIAAGSGPTGTITVGDFDRGIVSMLGLFPTAEQYYQLRNAAGFRPAIPYAFGTEQIVRKLGLRVNVPAGQDIWEEWPNQTLMREQAAVEAYELAHMPTWAVSYAQSEAAVASQPDALPAWTPLTEQVLSEAIRYAGAPYVWGGTSDQPQELFGQRAAGGFDCSGFVWWIYRDHDYRLANGSLWNASRIITQRTTYGMAEHLPVAKRIPYADLKPGDILFWDTNPTPDTKGVWTDWQAIGHTGIYLGNGWAIDSIGYEDGVSIDNMSQAAGGWWYSQFAFGWRVLPAGQ